MIENFWKCILNTVNNWAMSNLNLKIVRTRAVKNNNNKIDCTLQLFRSK